MADMMKQMSGMGIRDRMQTMQRACQGRHARTPAAKLAKQKKGTGKRLTPKERAKLKKAAREGELGGESAKAERR